MSIRIAGTGSYVPDRILTNADLEKMVETSDEWIRTRTGIEERHIAAPDQPTSDLAYHASLKALEMAGITGADLDAIIVATITTKVNKKSNYFPTHYIIRENPAFAEPSVIMLEQIRTIDKERVIEYLGKISQRDMSGIDRALMTSLSLNSENTVIKYVLKD